MEKKLVRVNALYKGVRKEEEGISRTFVRKVVAINIMLYYNMTRTLVWFSERS